MTNSGEMSEDGGILVYFGFTIGDLSSYFIQEGQRCPKRRVAQAVIRLATTVIKFRNKERNVSSPSLGECVRRAEKCKTFLTFQVRVRKRKF